MRAFVAIEVANPSVLDALETFQRRLSATGADLKLVERQNLHFTVRFLGEISQGQADEVDLRLRGLSAMGGEAEVNGVGAFPDLGKPRVVWAGVAGEGEGLLSGIAGKVRALLHGIGEEDERPFSPHLTLARVRSPSGGRSLSVFLRDNASISFGSTMMRSVKLKSSQLSGAGPAYKDVAEYPLA